LDCEPLRLGNWLDSGAGSIPCDQFKSSSCPGLMDVNDNRQRSVESSVLHDYRSHDRSSYRLSFLSSSSLLLCLFSLHLFLLCPLTFNRPKYPLHPLIIRFVLLNLLLLLNIGQKPCILPELSDSTLPLLFVLCTQFCCLVLLVIGISLTKIIRIRNLELGGVGRNWDGFMCLKLEGLTCLPCELQ